MRELGVERLGVGNAGRRGSRGIGHQVDELHAPRAARSASPTARRETEGQTDGEGHSRDGAR